jgi:hypothetical protein
MKMAVLTAVAVLVLGTGPAMAGDGGTLGDVLGDVATHAVDRAARDTIDSTLPPPRPATGDRERDSRYREHERGSRYREHDERYRHHEEERGKSDEHRRDGRGRDDNPGRGHDDD